jgi:hypothetical protein
MEDSNNLVFMSLKGGINASMSIRADRAPNRTAIFFFGTPYRYDENSLDQCAIIMEAATSCSRGNLHFCLENTTTSNAASLSSSRMMITLSGQVRIGTTTPDSFALVTIKQMF